jgi:hypothetical protein
MRAIFCLLLILVCLLTACQEEEKTPQMPLDALRQDTAAPTGSPPAAATAVLTRAYITATPEPSSTPFPTPNLTQVTDSPLDNVVLPGDWSDAPFQDESGGDHVLNEFRGREVVIQVVSAMCAPCIEQQQYLLAAIQDRLDNGLLPNAVFLTLGVSQQEPVSLIETVFKRELGKSWSTAETLLQGGTGADWMVGLASPQLVTALEDAFGPDAVRPEALTIIVVEPGGMAHITAAGLDDTSSLITIIMAYGS